jgi:hypothetical protein
MHRRNLYVWTQVFPVFPVHYKLLQWQLRERSGEVCEREFNKLRDKYAPHMYREILLVGALLETGNRFLGQDCGRRSMHVNNV